jgi:hypothetical protein
MAPEQPFDAYAEQYDAWFLENRNVLASEARMLARALGDPGVTLSVGCGSGLFESILRAEHGVEIRHGLEPATGMAEIARKRGLQVRSGAAEALPCEDGSFDTVLLNGIPSYVADLGRELLRTPVPPRGDGWDLGRFIPARDRSGPSVSGPVRRRRHLADDDGEDGAPAVRGLRRPRVRPDTDAACEVLGRRD